MRGLSVAEGHNFLTRTLPYSTKVKYSIEPMRNLTRLDLLDDPTYRVSSLDCGCDSLQDVIAARISLTQDPSWPIEAQGYRVDSVLRQRP